MHDANPKTIPEPSTKLSLPMLATLSVRDSSLFTATAVNLTHLLDLQHGHPNKSLVSHFANALKHGFHVASQALVMYLCALLISNLPFARMYTDFISEQLISACSNNESADPFDCTLPLRIHFSGLGAVPRKNGKLHMILHLSNPSGNSVNVFISRVEFSLQHVQIDDAIDHIMFYGNSASFLNRY